MPNPTNKKKWSAEEIQFIQDNFFKLTNSELAKALGLKLTLLRNKCISMGFKRMELEYWTEEQIQYLRDNYKSKGDLELAKIFEARWPKIKPWTLKHIEKKRNYLKLLRTAEELRNIKQGHIDRGAFREGLIRRWAKYGSAPDGTIRYWTMEHGTRSVPYIKVDGNWIHWNRWAWEKTHGAIPKKMNVIFIDGNYKNLTVENLALVSNRDLAIRNTTNRYPEEIRLAVKLTKLLDIKIKSLNKKLHNEEQKFRSA